jgi:hypothetical protein
MRKRSLSICVAVLLVCGLSMLFVPEILALISRIDHPSDAFELGAHRIIVPFGYNIMERTSQSLHIAYLPGTFRTRVLGQRNWSMISFDTYAGQFSAKEALVAVKIVAPMRGEDSKEFLRAPVGGEDTVCIRTDNKKFPQMTTVNCYPENAKGMHITFSGSPAELDAFREMLMAIQRK